MMERTTVRLPQDLLARAKQKASAQGRTLTSLIEDGLRQVLTDERKAAASQRAMPRVSKATGGLMPGVDLSDIKALQEGDDLDQIQRMTRFE